MNQLLESYTIYAPAVINTLFIITGIITLFYMIRLFVKLFKLSKTMKTLSATQQVIQSRLTHFNSVSSGLVAHYAKKREQNKYSVSTLAIKYLRKKKVF